MPVLGRGGSSPPSDTTRSPRFCRSAAWGLRISSSMSVRADSLPVCPPPRVALTAAAASEIDSRPPRPGHSDELHGQDRCPDAISASTRRPRTTGDSPRRWLRAGHGDVPPAVRVRVVHVRWLATAALAPDRAGRLGGARPRSLRHRGLNNRPCPRTREVLGVCRARSRERGRSRVDGGRQDRPSAGRLDVADELVGPRAEGRQGGPSCRHRCRRATAHHLRRTSAWPVGEV